MGGEQLRVAQSVPYRQHGAALDAGRAWPVASHLVLDEVAHDGVLVEQDGGSDE